jgi:hypothetical protein
MPFGDGTGPLGLGPGYWGSYSRGRGFRRWWNYPYGWRCWRYPWLPRWWWANFDYQNDRQPQMSAEAELAFLREEAEDLKKQLKEVKARIQELASDKKIKKIKN